MFIIAHAVREMCFVSVYLNNFKLHQFFVCLFFFIQKYSKEEYMHFVFTC